MDEQQAADVLRNLDLRTKRMEQILPDLPTRDEMRTAIDDAVTAAVAPLATKAELAAAIAPLATKAELAAAVAPLATKAELRELRAELHETRDELRRHMDVWAERIHDEVKLVAESHLALDARDARQHRDAIEELRRLSKTTARQHAEETKDLAKLDARLRKVEGKPPRKRRAS